MCVWLFIIFELLHVAAYPVRIEISDPNIPRLEPCAVKFSVRFRFSAESGVFIEEAYHITEMSEFDREFTVRLIHSILVLQTALSATIALKSSAKAVLYIYIYKNI